MQSFQKKSTQQDNKRRKNEITEQERFNQKAEGTLKE